METSATSENNTERGLPAHYWKPGQSGNPAGRPKGTLSLVSLIKKKLEEIDPELKISNAEVLIQDMFDRAKKGNDKIARDFINRIDGLPVQAIDLNANTTFRTFEIVRGKTPTHNATSAIPGEDSGRPLQGTDAPVA